MSNTLISEIAFALEAFMLDAEARQLRPSTLRYYRQQLTWFLSYAEDSGLRAVEQVSATTIRSYFTNMQARGLSQASVQAASRAIRAFCNFLVADELLARSPMQRVRTPKADLRKPDAYTQDEMKRIVEAADSPRDKAIVLCLLDTGCRASEFVAWNVGDVNVATGTVHVRHTKNRVERTVYLGTKTRRALLKHLATLPDRMPDTPLWQNTQTGERLLPNGLRQLVSRIGRKAGVTPCNPHKFRRTFATWCLRNGMNVHDLKALMGHSGLEMLMRYMDNDTKSAHKAFGAVDGTLHRMSGRA